MATRIRPKAKNLYHEDFDVWTGSQAELLRKRQFDGLDLDNLIEEVEGLGDAKKGAVLNNASIIIEHLLSDKSARRRIPGAAGPNRSSLIAPGSNSSLRHASARSSMRSCRESTP